jgi:hypothetical protein
MGCLNVAFRANGKSFQTSLIEEDVRGKVKLKDIVSFTFTTTSVDDIPIRPRIFQIRNDLTWKEVTTKRTARNRGNQSIWN